MYRYIPEPSETSKLNTFIAIITLVALCAVIGLWSAEEKILRECESRGGTILSIKDRRTCVHNVNGLK